MELILYPALALTAATLLLASLTWVGLWFARRRPARFWARTLWVHLFLLVVHSLLTVPLGFGVFATRFVHTRGDESAYRGPRITADGTWRVQTRETLAAERKAAPADGATEAADVAAEKLAVHFEASDGVPLRGFLVPAKSDPPRFVAVLVHGLFRGALELEVVGSMMRDAGGLVLLAEYRNHGGSGRAKATFGKDEAKDVAAAMRFLRARPEAKGRPLVLFGVSLGSAAATLAAADERELAALIVDAPIDDLRVTADRMLGGMATRRNLGPDIPAPLRAVILFSAEHLGGVDFAAVDIPAALRRLPPKLPVLFIGAGLDDRIPPECVKVLFDQLPTEPAKRQLWIVDGARHGRVWELVPDEYRKHLGDFLDLALGSKP